MAVTGRDRPPVLALRAPGIGDLLTAVPALRALRRGFPGDRLVLAAPAGLTGIVELIGGIDATVAADGPTGLHWSGPPPRLAVNLHGSGPQSIDALQATRPGELLTHRHPDRPGVCGPPWRSEVHEVRRWCDLVVGAGLQADPDDLDLARPATAPPVTDAVLVHPGAAHPSRRWPPGRFAELARALHAEGHRVVVTGGPAERELTAEVTARAGLPRSADLAPRCTLELLTALVAAARLVVCGDTGPAHLATAYRTPSVLLFGPTPPQRWGPERDGPHTVLWAGTTGDPHGDRPDPGLLQIGTGRVLRAARARLAGR
ncbi:ADP-heptose:LPS heptosyltransferase [Pseudonocardia ammonioxydans]|uniref:ADP-heptose:LPS heptosyltransferase n=1 Tax=Pseudonocardia ammonioxydans TaxID=260086 RepID=A0A1I4XQ70_PSUAM|nr:glycosyltransferase family 9 protein [Pseudonocardia ammonioxydans]SFN27985.1 ADP-heptose:LPS heptosyltransferase [Pseudonocardia ammonioxydans]